MASIHPDIEHLALLARLQLTEEERQTYQAQLNDILAYFEVLRELDVSEVPPTASILPQNTVLRDDAVRPGLTPEVLLRNLQAPNREADQFRVNAVIDGEQGNG